MRSAKGFFLPLLLLNESVVPAVRQPAARGREFAKYLVVINRSSSSDHAGSDISNGNGSSSYSGSRSSSSSNERPSLFVL